MDYGARRSAGTEGRDTPLPSPMAEESRLSFFPLATIPGLLTAQIRHFSR